MNVKHGFSFTQWQEVSGKIAVEKRRIPVDLNVLSQCVYFGLRASELQ